MSTQHLKVRAVIFDMDGVITNTMPDHYAAWKKVMIDEGVHVTYHDIYCREGQPGIISVREVFRKYGHEFEEKKARQILLKKEEYFKKTVRRRFVPGARRFIKKLYKDKFRLALVTGTSRHELHRILPDPLYELFSVVVTGNDVKHGKPHPEPYMLSLSKLKIKPSEGVVIENAPFGISSAKGAGLRCLALTTSLPAEYLKEADKIFTSFRDLADKARFQLVA